MNRWTHPVELDLPDCGHQTVYGPYAAAALLMISWPEPEDEARAKAEKICLEALAGISSAEEAREAFLDAIDTVSIRSQAPAMAFQNLSAEPARVA